MKLSDMTVYVKKAISGNFFSKLIRNGSGYSSKSFFLVSVTIVGIMLLSMPIYILIVETYYNHTIATNLSDMAAYIAAVAAVFTSVGLTKVWGEKNEHRLPGKDGIYGTEDDIVVKMSDDEWAKFIAQLEKQKLQNQANNNMGMNGYQNTAWDDTMNNADDINENE